MQRVHVQTDVYDDVKAGCVDSVIVPGIQVYSLCHALLIFKSGRVLPVFVTGLSLKPKPPGSTNTLELELLSAGPGRDLHTEVRFIYSPEQQYDEQLAQLDSLG